MNLEKRVFVIPHFHYDVAWISTEEEYLKIVYKILGKVMEIMEKDEDFTYVVDQAFYLEKMKRERSKLFRQVAERILEGRIEVVNAGYVMPDLNLISPFTIKKNYEIARARWQIDSSSLERCYGRKKTEHFVCL